MTNIKKLEVLVNKAVLDMTQKAGVDNHHHVDITAYPRHEVVANLQSLRQVVAMMTNTPGLGRACSALQAAVEAVDSDMDQSSKDMLVELSAKYGLAQLERETESHKGGYGLGGGLEEGY